MLKKWTKKSIKRWKERLDDNGVADDDPMRYRQGYWCVAFAVDPISISSIWSLKSAACDPSTSRLSCFECGVGSKTRPYPNGRCIETWLGADGNYRGGGFWRISQSGKAFLLMPLQENFMRTPFEENYNLFSATIPIFRIGEIIKFIELFAGHFSAENSNIKIFLRYENMLDRMLADTSSGMPTVMHKQCIANRVESQFSGLIKDIINDPVFTVHEILKPVYAHFEFYELNIDFVKRIIYNTAR